MRCLAKNIAMFGIGLPLYVGEDLAQFKDDASNNKSKKTTETEFKKAIDMINALANTEEKSEKVFDMIEKFNKNSLIDCTIEELRKIYDELKKIGG